MGCVMPKRTSGIVAADVDVEASERETAPAAATAARARASKSERGFKAGPPGAASERGIFLAVQTLDCQSRREAASVLPVPGNQTKRRGRRPPRISPEAILEAADAFDLNELSMPALASQLGVSHG